MTRITSDRQFCVRVLAEILQHRGSLANALGPNLKSFPHINAALVQEYCYGVCRWFHQLDCVTQILLDKPLRNKDNDIRCLILVGLYELFYMRTPAHAVLNETVAEAAKLGKPWAKNLVNAVLRKAQREQSQLLEHVEKDYTCKYSHPEWLLSRLKHNWPDCYRSILEANNKRAPMTLRVNIGKVTRTEYLDHLSRAGISAQAGRLSDNAIILDTPCDVNLLPGFSTGLISVQDEASQLVAMLLPLAPGLKVLDACAAPGGKTCCLLEAQPDLELIAMDRELRRIARLNDNLERLSLNASVVCGDICTDASLPVESFDRILLDVPCSATGVIRRHPDIKLLRTSDEVAKLVEAQAGLLHAAWKLLKPGGYLLYSTCSTLQEENSVQIAHFISDTSTAEHMSLSIAGSRACKFGFQLFPQENGSDGFFYALLRKRESWNPLLLAGETVLA